MVDWWEKRLPVDQAISTIEFGAAEAIPMNPAAMVAQARVMLLVMPSFHCCHLPALSTTTQESGRSTPGPDSLLAH
jgi:hypothetical protein